MRCDEVQSLHDPYLDSELDARTALEIERHLKACPECARLFAEEQELEARLKAGLNHGTRTAELWEQIEGEVIHPKPEILPQGRTKQAQSTKAQMTKTPLSGGVFRALSHLVFGFVSGLGFRISDLDATRSRFRSDAPAWAGLAAVWVVILALDLTARGPETRVMREREVPSASEMRFAWKQKQLLMADLAFLFEPAPADKPAPPAPQSNRHTDNLNT